ncbi:MAG TPA: HEAT repeat domain-containing protein [Myxococcaceae bacterium]|nr:HEAT repeat domain-containing protein [Myxococcaceae bacterium]
MNRVRGWKNLLGLVLGGGLLAGPAALAAGEVVIPRQVTCSYATLIEDLRAALKTGTPEFQRYMKEMLKEAALGMPPEELIAAIEREGEPSILEALGAALAVRASNTDDPKLLQPLLRRAMKDGDPSLRAAAVRGLRGIGSTEIMAKNTDVASYEQLIRDSSSEVREAVVGNLTHENAKVYFGHHAPATEAAISVAMASPDPELTAKLLREVSMEKVSSEGVRQITQQLRSDSPNLRSAAVTALGGVPASQAPEARNSLLELYRNERDPNVRKALLQAIARLGQASAVPTLESLRGVDASLAPEIDAWIKALKLPVQEWSLIQREKERLRK